MNSLSSLLISVPGVVGLVVPFWSDHRNCRIVPKRLIAGTSMSYVSTYVPSALVADQRPTRGPLEQGRAPQAISTVAPQLLKRARQPCSNGPALRKHRTVPPRPPGRSTLSSPVVLARKFEKLIASNCELEYGDG